MEKGGVDLQGENSPHEQDFKKYDNLEMNLEVQGQTTYIYMIHEGEKGKGRGTRWGSGRWR